MKLSRKTGIAALALAFGLAASAAADSRDAKERPQEEPKYSGRLALARLELGAEELERIEAILEKDEEAVAKARAEVRILQAKLARLMLERSVPMDQVQALVKESLEWEYTSRMIQIRRQVEIKQVLGDERWASLFRLGRSLPLDKEGKEALGKMDRERRERLLAILRRLN
ncbi:MAG TPA: hypothetical protein PLB91_15440 [Spirochaetales bacterium]|nr:hypothetical protein [Spirochaetales bacterium]HRZ64816.1 hypothetical protein [Spirochaetia bacterium]